MNIDPGFLPGGGAGGALQQAMLHSLHQGHPIDPGFAPAPDPRAMLIQMMAHQPQQPTQTQLQATMARAHAVGSVHQMVASLASQLARRKTPVGKARVNSMPPRPPMPPTHDPSQIFRGGAPVPGEPQGDWSYLGGGGTFNDPQQSFMNPGAFPIAPPQMIDGGYDWGKRSFTHPRFM